MMNLNPWVVLIGGGVLLAVLGYLYFRVTMYEMIQREEREEVTDDPTVIRDRAIEVFTEKFDHFSKKYGLFYRPMSIVGDREEWGSPVTGSSKQVSVPRALVAYDVKVPPQLVRENTMSRDKIEERLRLMAGEIQGNCDVEVHKPDGQTAYRVEVYSRGY